MEQEKHENDVENWHEEERQKHDKSMENAFLGMLKRNGFEARRVDDVMSVEEIERVQEFAFPGGGDRNQETMDAIKTYLEEYQNEIEEVFIEVHVDRKKHIPILFKMGFTPDVITILKRYINEN